MGDAEGRVSPSAAVPEERAAAREWAVRLFRRSVLKQEKLRRIEALLDDTEGGSCLDIGADNGVVSLLLRRRGGRWQSADLDPHTVEAITELLGERVERLDDGAPLPYPDATFDWVVVIDYLEHVAADAAFAQELGRIVKPGGRVLVNVPRRRRRNGLLWLRDRLGQTDAKHGHLRPGYSVEELTSLLGPRFELLAAQGYSRAFSELLDTGLNAVWDRLGGGGAVNGGSAKGRLVRQSDWERHRRQFRLLSMVYPLLWLVARLDALLFWDSGYKLIVKARRRA